MVDVRAPASAAEEKAYLAEVGVAWVRFAVIAFNIAVYWLFLAPQGVRWLAVTISVVASVYAVVIVTFRPYEHFAAMKTAAWTATTDASLIVLWIHASGGFASPFYLLWYLSLFAITFRYSATATALAAILYAGLYTAQVAATGVLAEHAVDVAIRDAYILLVGAIGSILARESLRVFVERFEVGRQAQESQGFRELAEANPEAVAIVGDGVILEANRAYCVLVGKSREAVIGTTPQTVTPDPEVQGRIQGLLAKGTGVDEAWVRFEGAKAPRLVRAAATPIVYQGSSAVFVALRDVTEERAAEDARRVALKSDLEVKRLKQVDRFKTDFINTAAHELSTPLTPIKIQLHLLRQRLAGVGPHERNSFDIVARNLDRLAALVKDMLDVARLQSGRLGLQPAVIDLSRLVHEAVETFQPSAEQAGVRLMASVAGALQVEADDQRITQVLFNLLSNALKFTPRGGRVQVEAGIVDGMASVRVEDTGMGLSADQIERLFQPFAQMHREVLDVPGTGLGLYISQGIAKRHGGSLAASSRGPGLGATFTLRLPLVQPAPTPASA